MKKKTMRALKAGRRPGRPLRPTDIALRLRGQRDQLALLLADTEARLAIVEAEARPPQDNLRSA